MKSAKRIDYETRDGIPKLLTDAEIARVSTAEAAALSNATSSSSAGRFVLLAAVDDSERALDVVTAATGFARLISGAEVHLLYVNENLSGVDPSVNLPLDVQQAALEKGRVRLEDLGREARAHSSARMVAHVAIGDPWREIVQSATDLQADVVLVGTHDREGIASAVLGSVAQTVARKAPCPVLVVRPKKSRHQDVPEIEPLCPECQRAQADSGGAAPWCARHSEHHPGARCHYEVPQSFGLGSMLIRD